jgi:hypothetical protein
LRVDRIPRGNAEKRVPVLIVTVSVALAVFAPVMVAALGNWNAPVKVFDTPDRRGSMSFVSMATMRSSKSTPRSNNSASISSSSLITSRCAAHSIAEPRAIV